MKPPQRNLHAELGHMGKWHYDGLGSWYLVAASGVGFDGYIWSADSVKWVAMLRRSAADLRVEFSDPIAAATWLLMEVQGG